jgi:hypothetical protein
MGLTVGEVALIAAGIGLASPLIAYWTTARLDRERWIRAERSKVYVDMLAVYGRMARNVSHQEEEYHLLSREKWRLLQARVEAFASNRVIALRDPYLNAWNRFVEEKAELDAVDEVTDSSTAELLEQRKNLVDEQALAVGSLYLKLRDAIREELKVGRASPKLSGRLISVDAMPTFGQRPRRRRQLSVPVVCIWAACHVRARTGGKLRSPAVIRGQREGPPSWVRAG